MTVPPEVLVTTMRTNQKYLALRTPDGALAPPVRRSSPTSRPADGGAAIVAGNERVLRARLWDAQVLLGPGPQGLAGEPPAGARQDGLPRRARHAGPAGGAAGGAGGCARAVSCRAPTGCSPSAPRCWPRPIWSPAWSASSPSCRASWAATTPRRRASRRRWRRRSASTMRPRARTTLPDRAGERGRGAGRQARHAGRLLRRRHPPDRLQGPVRAAPRRPRRHPADVRERAAPAAAPGVRGGSRTAMATASPRVRRRERADRLPRRPPEGPSARAGRAPRPDRGRVRRRRGGRSGPPAGPRRGAAGVPRQRGRAQPARRLPPRQQHRRRSRRRRTGGATTGIRSQALLVEPAEEALYAALESAGGAHRGRARG